MARVRFRLRRGRVRPRRARVGLSVSIILVLAAAVACTGTPTPSASGQPNNTAMVLSEAIEPASLNPLDGYAPDGAGQINQGLLEHQSDGSLAPVLASAMPVPSADGKSWTVTVTSGVKFSDGSPFTAADVLATYRALLNPVVDSPLRSRYSMLDAVDQVDATTVRFDLAYTYPAFPKLLVLGILPAAALASPGPVSQSPLNRHPIGTGPYELASWTAGQSLVLVDNPRFSPAAKVKKVTVVFDASDTDRATRLRDGKLDGAPISPEQVAMFAHSDTFTVLTDPAADLRAVTLPSTGPAADPTIRLALNEAVDRNALVNGPMAGLGLPAYTPMPSVLPEFVETSATFTYDTSKAQNDLQAAGWVPGPNGMRAKAGVAAAFTLDYPTGDTLDKDLATAFAADAKAIGITVTLAAVAPADLAGKAATDATLISTGDPFDPDLALYPLLGNSTNADLAGDLNAARHQLDPAQRSVDYRSFQKSYVAAPTLVCLVFTDHEYVLRDDWNGYQQVTDSATADTTWGPWWNLATWVPR